jgi:vancomycin resistance protein YoaR
MSKAQKKSRFIPIFIYILVGILSVIFLLVVCWLFLFDKMYPLIKVAGTDISLMTYSQSKNHLDQVIKQRLNQNIQFTYSSDTETLTFQLNAEDVSIDTQNALTESFAYGHQKPYFGSVKKNIDVTFKPTFDFKLQSLSTKLNQPPIDSQIKVDGEQILVTPSQPGLEVDEAEIKNQLIAFINGENISDRTIKVRSAPARLSYETALKIKKRLDEIKLEPLKMTFKDKVYTLTINDLVNLIDLESSQPSLASLNINNQNLIIESIEIGGQNFTDTNLTLNQQKVSNYFRTIAVSIDRPAQEPLFSVENTSDPNKPKIKEFQPPVEGQTLDIPQAINRLSDALIVSNKQVIELPVQITPPKNKLVNDYGIKELIGRGQSNFAGSIEGRIFNVGLAASRINGVLVAPGEEFSFVNTVGDISGASGYKQAYVIKSGRTVLDDGGGVCQVSTTIFRAALNAGMPITNRVAHAYRVGYYEQGYPPGIDATIFSPTVDFKFKNDTTHYILIQAKTVGTSLTIDLYGTSDGRIANISTPVITGITPAPPELRQDDPTLPKGTVKQVDWAASGANVVFTRTVTRNGQTLYNDTFRSNYRPWQAVYLVGTKEG